MFKRLKLGLQKAIPRPKIRDEIIQEVGLIGFFCLFGVGLWWQNPSLCFIICGLMGMWFFFPRGR